MVWACARVATRLAGASASAAAGPAHAVLAVEAVIARRRVRGARPDHHTGAGGALAHAACALRSVPSFQQPSSASTSIGKTTSNRPSPAFAVKNTRKLTALIS